MEAQARAGIDVCGSVLRYAIVEHYGARLRLLRLGSCDFRFDVTEFLFTRDDAEQVRMLRDALSDALSGSVAGRLNVVVHPPDGHSFITPLTQRFSSSERRSRLQQEATLIAGAEQKLHVSSIALPGRAPDDRELEWLHVLAVNQGAFGRFAMAVRSLPHPRNRLITRMQAAAAITERLSSVRPDQETGDSLVLGCFPRHVEYTYFRAGKWYFSKYSDALAPSDVAYLAVEMVTRLGRAPSIVENILLYGTDVDLARFSEFETVFEVKPRLLNPLEVLDLDPGNLAADFESEAYVGCLGAAL